MDFDSLNNISDFVLNESLINDSTQVISNIATNADASSGGWFGLVAMFSIYLITTYFLYRDDELFRLDFIKASLFGSFVALTVGIILLTQGYISNFRHVMWMFLVMLASVIANWLRNQP